MPGTGAAPAGAADAGGGGPPGGLPDAVPDFVSGVVNGAIHGLQVAARRAGDIVSGLVPDQALDAIPFLVQHAGDVLGVLP